MEELTAEEQSDVWRMVHHFERASNNLRAMGLYHLVRATPPLSYFIQRLHQDQERMAVAKPRAPSTIPALPLPPKPNSNVPSATTAIAPAIANDSDVPIPMFATTTTTTTTTVAAPAIAPAPAPIMKPGASGSGNSLPFIGHVHSWPSVASFEVSPTPDATTPSATVPPPTGRGTTVKSQTRFGVSTDPEFQALNNTASTELMMMMGNNNNNNESFPPLPSEQELQGALNSGDIFAQLTAYLGDDGDNDNDDGNSIDWLPQGEDADGDVNVDTNVQILNGSWSFDLS
jgi:hypothetical protein